MINYLKSRTRGGLVVFQSFFSLKAFLWLFWCLHRNKYIVCPPPPLRPLQISHSLRGCRVVSDGCRAGWELCADSSGCSSEPVGSLSIQEPFAALAKSCSSALYDGSAVTGDARQWGAVAAGTARTASFCSACRFAASPPPLRGPPGSHPTAGFH